MDSADTLEENGSGKKVTPRKRKTPAKGMGGEGDDDEDTGSNFDDTPSKKKSALNKVQGGRVSKPSRARAAAPARGRFAELSDNEDEDGAVKEESLENGSDGFVNNGYSNGYSNGHENGFADDHNGYAEDGIEDRYYDIHEEA